MSLPLNSGTAANILLVEEYDALAQAFVLALAKFAPQHGREVAPNLPAAIALARAQNPVLVVIDFDPPPPNWIDLLEELKAIVPEARLLIVAAGVLRAAAGNGGSLVLLNKPFELSAFGAAVQGLLMPETAGKGARGRMGKLDLADILALACVSEERMAVRVRADEARTGQILIRQGEVIHAVAGEWEGEAALAQMFSWKNVRFSQAALPSAPLRNMQRSWHELAPAPLPPESPPNASSPPIHSEGPKIIVIDDTEMLLLFVEDFLTLAIPGVQITTVASGLEGVDKAAQLRPNLALVDYSMPDLRGDEVCRRLRAAPETSHMPVIMMSGHVQEMAHAATSLPNVVATIAKPFLSESLVALVREKLQAGPLANGPGENGQSSIAILSEHGDAPSSNPAPLRGRDAIRQAPDAPNGANGSAKPDQNASETPKPARTHEDSSVRQTRTDAPLLAGAEVLLELPLDVINMEFTTRFQIGSIRARLASPTVSIEIPALAARASLPSETAFQLGEIDLGTDGQIGMIRLLPTTDSLPAIQSPGACDRQGLTVIPADNQGRLELMPAAAVKMRMQLFAALTLQAVELSPTLEVKQLVLSCRSNAVRVALDPQTSTMQGGAAFVTTSVRLDSSGRLGELTLSPTPTR